MVGRGGCGGRRGVDAAGPRRWAAAGLLAAAGVTYNDWLLQWWVPTGLDWRDSYVSEAFAADQPHRVLFNAIELATAAMVLAAAGLAGSVPGRRGWPAAGWGAVAAFGACSVADVALPMRCAPSREAGCPIDSVAHTLTSGLVHLSVFASIAAFVLAVRSAPRGGSRAGRWAVWLLPVSMATAIASAGPYVGYPGGQGIAQRLHLVTVGIWLWLLAADLPNGPPHLPGRPGPSADAAGALALHAAPADAVPSASPPPSGARPTSPAPWSASAGGAWFPGRRRGRPGPRRRPGP
ncbi:DUF998 domain-containing protein [Streptomyces varsoviensis]|uniref:DUF998 domain-containing protein n=1 Tax=Streptomyces varsoviensis TaxID=67373 RepID=UPI00200F1219|nr:DUF998 domain-containing protein [Streptomyces varsoviensis]